MDLLYISCRHEAYLLRSDQRYDAYRRMLPEITIRWAWLVPS